MSVRGWIQNLLKEDHSELCNSEMQIPSIIASKNLSSSYEMILGLIYLTPVFYTSASYSEIFIHVFFQNDCQHSRVPSIEAEPDHYSEMFS